MSRSNTEGWNLKACLSYNFASLLELVFLRYELVSRKCFWRIYDNFLPMLTCFIYLNCPFIICVWSKRHRYIDVGHPCSVLFSFLIVLVNFVTMRAWFTLFFQDPDQYDTDLYAVNIEIYIWWQLHYCEKNKLLEDVKVLWNTKLDFRC